MWPAWQLPAAAAEDDDEVKEGWRQLDLMCAISRRRLESPARGEQCRHPAQCNEAELRAYVGREKRCPIASCCARLDRTAAIVRHTDLQATHIHMYTYTHTHAYAYTYTYTCIHTCIYTYTYTRIHTYAGARRGLASKAGEATAGGGALLVRAVR